MQRVLVMGCSGSVGAPFWKPGRVEPDRDEFRDLMVREASKPAWVMDRTYLASLPPAQGA